MSRWLKSVNNILETLDDRAENVAEDGRGLLRAARVASASSSGDEYESGDSFSGSEVDDGSYDSD